MKARRWLEWEWFWFVDGRPRSRWNVVIIWYCIFCCGCLLSICGTDATGIRIDLKSCGALLYLNGRYSWCDKSQILYYRWPPPPPPTRTKVCRRFCWPTLTLLLNYVVFFRQKKKWSSHCYRENLVCCAAFWCRKCWKNSGAQRLDGYARARHDGLFTAKLHSVRHSIASTVWWRPQRVPSTRTIVCALVAGDSQCAVWQ